MMEKDLLKDEQAKKVTGGLDTYGTGIQVGASFVVGAFYTSNGMDFIYPFVFKYLGVDGGNHKFLVYMYNNGEIITSYYVPTELYTSSFEQCERPGWLPAEM